MKSKTILKKFSAKNLCFLFLVIYFLAIVYLIFIYGPFLQGDTDLSRIWGLDLIPNGKAHYRIPASEGDFPFWTTTVLKPGYDLKGSIGKKVLMDKGHFTGMHSQDDAFFYIEGKAEQRSKVIIYDVLPTILERMKLSLPADLDGKNL